MKLYWGRRMGRTAGHRYVPNFYFALSPPHTVPKTVASDAVWGGRGEML
jgi:hypothetical protein